MATMEETLGSLGQEGQAYLNQINQYASELQGEAQRDYDFIVKYLKKQFETALGTDDTARQEFLVKVADKLEQRIGRIPYDYDLYTGRAKEDIANYLRRSEVQKQDANAREDEFLAQQGFAVRTERKQLAEASNARGMLGSGIQKGEQLQLDTKRQLYETDPFNRTMALERTQREEADKQAILDNQREQTDITNKYRREAIDEQLGYDQGIENSDIDLWKKKNAIARQKSSALQDTLVNFGMNGLG